MSKFTLFSGASLATILASLLAASGAAAQTSPQGSAVAGEKAASVEPTTSDEVIVTATRRDAKVLDVPYNISAVSGQSIDANHVQNNAELLRGVPGVSSVDRGARNQGVATNIQMRGVNVDSSALGDYFVPTVAPVSTYVNETPLFANFVLTDIDRVEILRGPQGTLYGSGSLGGTIRYIMRRPEFGAYSGRASATASQVNGSDGVGGAGDLMVNIPLGEKAALRLSGALQNYPGVVDYVNLYKLDAGGLPVIPPGSFPSGGLFSSNAVFESKKDADTVDIKYGRAALRFAPFSNTDLLLTYARQSDDIGGRRQVTRGTDGFGRPYGKYENGAVIAEPSHREVELLSLEGTIDLGFATLTSSTSHADHTGDSVSDNTGFYAGSAGFSAFYYNYPRPAVPAYRTYGDNSYTQELRLVSKTGGAFDYLIGAYYSDQTLSTSQVDYVLGFKRWYDAAIAYYTITGDKQFVYSTREKLKDAAVFGELTWHLNDRAQITGGLRHFKVKSDASDLVDLPSYAFFGGVQTDAFSSSTEKTLFKANGSWKFSDTALLYGTVSQGYRRGGINAVPTKTGFRYQVDSRWQTYKPDTVVNYELGVKGTRGGLTYNAALFYIDWSDIQLNTSTVPYGFYVVANGDKARSMGLEAQIEGRISDLLHYSLGYTYTNAELTADFRSPSPNPLLTQLVATKGARLPGSPEHALTLAVDHTFTLDNNARVILRTNGYYQSSTLNTIGNIPGSINASRMTPFQLWSATATYAAGSWDASVFVKNIFNADGVTGRFTQSYMGTNPAANFYGNASRDFITLPRTIGVAVGYKF